MAATVVVYDRTIDGNKRITIGYYTMSFSGALAEDTLTITKMRSVNYIKLMPGDSRAMHTWTTAVASRDPCSATSITVSSSSASYTTGGFIAWGY